MPNQNERTESVLALVPGVVRGPDGRINMKGARNTQSGALVNSANVTDPATGSSGLDVPIDVVASVQVISNPYDSQYGKLTGAVSTIDKNCCDPCRRQWLADPKCRRSSSQTAGPISRKTFA